MRQFKDKVCVITGAGSGIGAACARAMAAHRVPVLETFAMTAVRGDQSRDGIHYRTTRDLATNSVPRTVLQVLLQALCASA